MPCSCVGIWLVSGLSLLRYMFVVDWTAYSALCCVAVQRCWTLDPNSTVIMRLQIGHSSKRTLAYLVPFFSMRLWRQFVLSVQYFSIRMWISALGITNKPAESMIDACVTTLKIRRTSAPRLASALVSSHPFLLSSFQGENSGPDSCTLLNLRLSSLSPFTKY